MTIRKCIEKMREVSTKVVVLRNRTKIYIHEINANKNDYFGTIKWNPDGSIRVIRRIFCTIEETSRTKMLDELKSNKDWWMYVPNSDYNYFRENDFILPERKMNEFISANDGIDEYETISVPYYMMVDCMNMMNESLETLKEIMED